LVLITQQVPDVTASRTLPLSSSYSSVTRSLAGRLDPEDEGSMISPNARSYSPKVTASHPLRPNNSTRTTVTPSSTGDEAVCPRAGLNTAEEEHVSLPGIKPSVLHTEV